MARLGTADMIAAGPRAVSRYTGTLFAVFVAQSLIAAACMVGVALVLAQAFAHLPMFDEAVDGDPMTVHSRARIGFLSHRRRPNLLPPGHRVVSMIAIKREGSFK